MNKIPIFNDEYLTDEEEDSQHSDECRNFYNFISTQARTNPELANYLYDLGWSDKSETCLLEASWIQEMYELLGPEAKKTMKNNYLSEIRKITRNPSFNLVGGFRRKTRKYLKKSKKRVKKSFKKRVKKSLKKTC
jgi:hypothetical protein